MDPDSNVRLNPAEQARTRSDLPVLFIHGFASTALADWGTSGWQETLNSSGRESLMPDLPGHGSSTRPLRRADVDVSGMTRFLAHTIRDAATGPVDVIGYSLGSRLAWELARVHHELVSSLVLGGISPSEPFTAVDQQQIDRFLETGEAPPDALTGMITQMISAPGNDAGALALCIDGLRSEPFNPAPGDVRVPTTFVAGIDDPMASGIDQLVALVPGSDLIRVPGDHLEALHGRTFRHVALRAVDASTTEA